MLLVFVVGGFVVLASATATGETADSLPALTGYGGPGEEDTRSVGPPPAVDRGSGGVPTPTNRAGVGWRGIRVGYGTLALTAAFVWVLRRLARGARARRRG